MPARWLLLLRNLLCEVKAKELKVKPVTFVKLKPTDQMRTIVAMLLQDESPHMVSLVTFAAVIFLPRTWLPGKKTIVVLDEK